MPGISYVVSEGGSQAQVDALRSPDTAARDDVLFDAAELGIIRLTIELTRDAALSDETHARFVAAVPSEQHQVEVVATVAAYNMVSRMIVAFRIEPEPS